jgi:hypothetical protein
MHLCRRLAEVHFGVLGPLPAIADDAALASELEAVAP